MRGLDAHQGTVTLFDGETGVVQTVMNASAITAIRTAAVSAVATTSARARRTRSKLAILGAGVQARSHLDSMRAIRDFGEIVLYSPTAGHAQALAKEFGVETADSAEEAVRDADVVVTATNATSRCSSLAG